MIQNWESSFASAAVETGGTHCYTSFNFAYLSRANVLAKTVKAAHPDWTTWAIIVDILPAGVQIDDLTPDFDHVVFAHELPIHNFKQWIFKHDVVEACTAVKGAMMLHVLASGAKKVVYLDPDIAVFHGLSNVVSKLDDFSIILTPHQVEPNTVPSIIRDNEITSLQYGIYNLGFVAVKNDEVGINFASWWADRLNEACYDQIEAGIFTDQKYCDLVPGLFPSVYIERDPGMNVASWNISTRKVHFTRNGTALVNGSPLKFYHFTKVNTEGDIMTSRYAGRNSEVLEIWYWYKRTIAESRGTQLKATPWAYDYFANGEKIRKSHREYFRYNPGVYSAFLNPFTVGEGSFHNLLQSSDRM
jgi:hypothetical protein